MNRCVFLNLVRCILVEASVNCCFLRKLSVVFLALIDREGVGLIIIYGCDQMACARSKEVYGLRIFGHLGLLIIWNSVLALNFSVCFCS